MPDPDPRTSNQGNGHTCSSATPSPSRLVAKILMTGVGGVGKTRLATGVTAWLADEFPDGVWVFELAAVTDPGAVPDAVAAVLGITEQPGKNMSGRAGGQGAAVGDRQLRTRP